MSSVTETQLKLRDAGIQMKLAVEHIGDEDVFMCCVNSYIASARSITFVMQRGSAPYPELTNWYNDQMAQLKSLPLMKFFQDQRTHTIHRGVIKPDSRSMRVSKLVIDGKNVGSSTATIWLFPEAKKYMPHRSGGVIKLCEEYFLILKNLVHEWLKQKQNA